MCKNRFLIFLRNLNNPCRNFEYAWSPSEDGGSSSDPCSEVYSGPRANSEPEVQALTNFLKTNSETITAVISLHSYGPLILTPWAHTNNKLPKDMERMNKAAGAIRDEIARVAKSENRKSSYTVGQASSGLYVASGMVLDYTYGALNITHSYLIELPGEAEGVHYGFLLPPAYIKEIGRETSAGIAAMAEYI